jgi:hypothetical protein
LKPNYEILRQEPDCVVIIDRGPWDKHRTITNGVEEVVAELLPILQGRRLLYFDSARDLAEILIKDGKFDGFKPL